MISMTSPHRHRSARAEQTTEQFPGRSAHPFHFSTSVDCFVDNARAEHGVSEEEHAVDADTTEW